MRCIIEDIPRCFGKRLRTMRHPRAKMEKLCQGCSLFMNWFNGICAPLCGGWMMLSATVDLPLSWNDWMPLSI